MVVTDGRRPQLLAQTLKSLGNQNMRIVFDPEHAMGVGGSKNYGAKMIYRSCDVVMFSDDDMYYLPGWEQKVEQAYHKKMVRGITQLGLWSHPYNHVTDVIDGIGSVNAAHGGAFVMSWDDWDRLSGFMDNAHGPGKSEDWEFSQRIIKEGGKVACMVPFVAIHCGITNCEGKPATGADMMRALADAKIRVHGLDGVLVC